MLIAPDLAPITFAVGFLSRPLAEVAAALRAWYAETDMGRELRWGEAPLPDALRRLEPLSAPLFRRLWVETTAPRWPTAYFDGFINGTDAFPPVSYLAQRLGGEGLILGLQPQSPRSYGAASIALYGPAPTDWLNRVWSVGAVNDGGRWTWERSGAPQPFEEEEAYAARRVRDRLTPERLARYAAALGAPLDPAAFGPRFVEDVPKRVPRGQRAESLATARERCGRAPAAG
jgi:hypothetical protein